MTMMIFFNEEEPRCACTPEVIFLENLLSRRRMYHHDKEVLPTFVIEIMKGEYTEKKSAS